MLENRTTGDRIFEAINTALLFLITVICVYPLLYVIFASFSNAKQLVQHSGLLYKPLGFSLEGYKIVLRNPNIINGYMNTIFYVLVGTTLNVLMTAMGAYVISRKKFLWKKPLWYLS